MSDDRISSWAYPYVDQENEDQAIPRWPMIGAERAEFARYVSATRARATIDARRFRDQARGSAALAVIAMLAFWWLGWPFLIAAVIFGSHAMWMRDRALGEARVIMVAGEHLR